jgi:hypothetical protein
LSQCGSNRLDRPKTGADGIIRACRSFEIGRDASNRVVVGSMGRPKKAE